MSARGRDFDLYLDELQEKMGICPRLPDGYLGGIDHALTPAEIETRFAAVGDGLESQGFTERAVQALRNAGYDAFRNCVGHIAIRPQNQ